MARTAIAPAAFNLIVAEEVTSQKVYEKKYRRPVWPGEQSGVTIGIGYDVGYATPDRLRRDWAGRIPSAMVEALTKACGVRGAAAAALARSLRAVVDVPWSAAIAVFRDVEIPRWCRTVEKALPNTHLLSDECFGAIVSCAYNRGPSFSNSGERYREMRAIKAHMAAQNFAAIPDELRAMARLWPNAKGLRERRAHEAELFAFGLRSPATRPPRQDPVPVPAPRPPDPEPDLDAFDPTDASDPADQKPAGESRTLWTKIIEFLGIGTGGGLLAAFGNLDWRAQLALIVVIALSAAFTIYIIRERLKRPDIRKGSLLTRLVGTS